MIPKSLSATSMDTAELCMARWEAENFHRGRGIANSAASIGSTVHNALELYVTKCIMTQEFPATIKQLLEFFKMSYMSIFGTGDFETEDYHDGEVMLKAWHKRTDFSTFEVLSCEVKESFPLVTSAGEIPFNYIWDRFDRIKPGEYRVVDYKSNRWGLNPADLKKKVQARAYAVAAQIKLKGEFVERIWVEFDMLRHDGPVGVVFTYEDNAAMWRFMQRTAERIIETPEGGAEETLNQACNFCVRKLSCEALRKNLLVGGIASIGSPLEAVDLRTSLEYQAKALARTMAELDELILTAAKEEDRFEFESDRNKMTIAVSSRRAVDADRVALVIGEDLFRFHGGRSITLANVDKLIKGPELTDQQKLELKALIFKNQGEPRVKVEPKSVIDQD